MNNVALSVVVSKDRDNFAAIKKVSDSLTVVNTFVPAGKNEDGSYKKTANMTIRLTSKTEITGEIKNGSHLDVEGFFVTNEYGNNAYLQIVARKVTVKTFEAKPEDADEVAQIVDDFADECPFK